MISLWLKFEFSFKFYFWRYWLCHPTKLTHGTARGITLGKGPCVYCLHDHPPRRRRLHEQNMHCCEHVYPAACHRAIAGKISVETDGVDGPTWVASPFTGCKRVCQSDSSDSFSLEKEFLEGFAFQDRSVQCFSRSGLLIGDSHCAHLMKPRAYRRCWCGVSWCPSACKALTLADFLEGGVNSSATGASDDHDSDFECLGCYDLGQDDDVASVNVDAKEMTCVNWTQESPCHSGLPFFRMVSNEMSTETCFEFCLSKGLDLFGLVKGVECRCGASRLNSAVWRDRPPRPGMELSDKFRIGFVRYASISGTDPSSPVAPSQNIS
eukprot:s526_g38.t1